MTADRTITAVLTDQQGDLRVAAVTPPELGPTDIRIAVTAATINPIDDQVIGGFSLRQGWTKAGDLGLGWDVAGVISEVGAEVTDASLTVGTRVAGLSGGTAKTVGPQAEEIVLAATDIAVVPDGLDLTDAASLPLNTLTADQALDLLGPAAGTLLITGIGGAVGGFAAPLAVARGWRVIGLGREQDREFAASVGVEFVTDEFIAADSTAQVDAVLDAAVLGGATTGVVRPGGTFVEVVVGATPPRDGVTVHTQFVTSDGTRLAALLAQADQGTLAPRIRSTHRLADAEKAYVDFRDGGRGRVLLVTDRAE
ncbi:NADP-dependent oxidoreductase [Gordonia soli]|uniref:Putative oxidoreductase n=1 Tax=Gordonia soli NBRC 108243 TaxID=1223545 RepID=M0QMA8_9ACTN|nr:NADP-dependent oxidoreductase [Gordonia soli]GAC69795.1 putative oxidoreductase [Gordonia soli NBRC 108243]